MVSFLLENGADVTLPNTNPFGQDNGKTPLDIASERGHTSIVKLLNQCGGASITQSAATAATASSAGIMLSRSWTKDGSACQPGCPLCAKYTHNICYCYKCHIQKKGSLNKFNNTAAPTWGTLNSGIGLGKGSSISTLSCPLGGYHAVDNRPIG